MLRPAEPATKDFYNERIQGLESGLGDYFPCSFSGRSDFAKEIFEAVAKRNPGSKVPPRNLGNHRLFTEIDDQTEIHDAGNVWAGAFWQVRSSIGQDTTDKLLVAAWKHFAIPGVELATFPEELVRQDTALYAGAHIQQIRSVFQERGLKF
jgi:hypothetical protein